MWFGGWEETLCPVKAPANIVSLLQEKIVAENMAGKNWKKYMKAKRERPWVKKNLWKKRSCRYGKRKHLWGGDVISICIIYWSDIHVWAYILKADVLDVRTPQKIQICRRIIVWERENYQFQSLKANNSAMRYK